MDTLYFAYGSNINLDQMAFRCPDATVIGPVTLENYELLFRGNGDGFGVAVEYIAMFPIRWNGTVFTELEIPVTVTSYYKMK